MSAVDTHALACKLVELPRFRFCRGMRLRSRRIDGVFVTLAAFSRGEAVLVGNTSGGSERASLDSLAANWLPDLDDAGTRGHLLALVREAWAGAAAIVYPKIEGDKFTTEMRGWVCVVPDAPPNLRAFTGDTEAAALVAALEAAP